MAAYPDVQPLEPLLAGTLTLLHYQAVRDAAHPVCVYSASKLACNLQRLANHPAISEALATVLYRLSCDWARRAGERMHPLRSEDDDDDQPLPTWRH